MFKPSLSAVRLAAILFVIVSCWFGQPSWAQQKYLAVIVEHESGSVDALISGVKDALKVGGFIEGKSLRLSYQAAQSQNHDLSKLAQVTIAGKPDAILALTAPVTLAAVSRTTQIPIVFGDVHEVAAGKLLAAITTEPPATNLSGVVSSVSINKQIELIRTVVPQAKRVGVLYNPAVAASTATVKQLMEGMAKFGMVLIESTVTRSRDVGSAARSMVTKVDVFLSIDDLTVSDAYPALVKVANDGKVPLIATQLGAVRQGALAGFEFSQKEVGSQIGRMLVKILKGAKPGTLPPETIARPALWLNAASAKKQGFKFPDNLLKSASQVVND